MTVVIRHQAPFGRLGAFPIHQEDRRGGSVAIGDVNINESVQNAGQEVRHGQESGHDPAKRRNALGSRYDLTTGQ
ncbi:hypothetical protein ACVOMS_35695 (plasmid) [Bradyrhizobium guangxiense]